jgi:hypothetical protein
MIAVERLRTTVRQQQAAHEAQRRQDWEKIEQLWQQCCQAEGIDVEAQGVVFRRDNAYLPAYDEALRAYLTLRTQGVTK